VVLRVRMRNKKEIAGMDADAQLSSGAEFHGKV
jgi:hypothetical protein